MKLCSGCGETKPLSAFAADNRARAERTARTGLGVAARCRICNAEARKPGISAQRAALQADRASLAARGLKTCSVCSEAKPRESFSKRAASPDGLSYKCRTCQAGYAKAWKEENPDAFKQWAAPRKDALYARANEWRLQNLDRRAQYMAEWSRANAAKINANGARRHAAKLQATPSWADPSAIEAVYARAAELTKLTGVRHEVDHFYPMQGKTVCGLHCEANLQVLTEFENISKLNRMPEAWAKSRALAAAEVLSE